MSTGWPWKDILDPVQEHMYSVSCINNVVPVRTITCYNVFYSEAVSVSVIARRQADGTVLFSK